MPAELIRELLSRTPFDPFEVHLANGEVHLVKHPECIALSKSRLIIVDPDTERLAICSVLPVASVEMAQPASK